MTTEISNTLSYPCGCINGIDELCGAQVSVLKCEHHKECQRETGELGEDYYKELGALDSEAPARYCGQFLEAFGVIDRPSSNNVALEIGAGASLYVPLVIGACWSYVACEPSRWARQWILEQYGHLPVSVINSAWEDHGAEFYSKYGMILCIHSLEHMADAPAALVKMSDCLIPGGTLYILVPDDSDPVNPDHLYFFNRITLKRAIEHAGLVVEKMEMRKYVPRENFLYCKARKPE